MKTEINEVESNASEKLQNPRKKIGYKDTKMGTS